ncbi:unnamed protein product, partial [Meganyctiphanes norvegica]
ETTQMAEKHEAMAAELEKQEKIVQVLKKECHEEDRRSERLYNSLRSATESFRVLEDASVDKISHHTVASKALTNLKKKVKDSRALCRELEDSLVDCERQAASAALKSADGRAALMVL